MSTLTTPPSSHFCEPSDSTSPLSQQRDDQPAHTETLKITEIFYSIQGESTFSGLPCIFIRLTACNLRCAWCDTTYSFSEGEPLSLEAIEQQVGSFPCRLVEITGGEPLLQPSVYELMRRLIEKNYKVLLETSGEQSVARVPPEVVKIVDVKCPSSGEAFSFNLGNLKYLTSQDELKFVIADETDYRFAREFIRTEPIPPAVAILFSPVCDLPARAAAEDESSPALAATSQRARQLAEWVLRDHLPVRLQLQMHKWLWGPDARGV